MAELERAVCAALDLPGCRPQSDQSDALRPEPCATEAQQVAASTGISIAASPSGRVQIGERVKSDGTAEVTLTRALHGTADAPTPFRWGFDAGPLAAAHAGVAAGVHGGASTTHTWSFGTEREADRFRDRVARSEHLHHLSDDSGAFDALGAQLVGGVVDFLDGDGSGAQLPPPDRREVSLTGGAHLTGEAGATVGARLPARRRPGGAGGAGGAGADPRSRPDGSADVSGGGSEARSDAVSPPVPAPVPAPDSIPDPVGPVSGDADGGAGSRDMTGEGRRRPDDGPPGDSDPRNADPADPADSAAPSGPAPGQPEQPEQSDQSSQPDRAPPAAPPEGRRNSVAASSLTDLLHLVSAGAEGNAAVAETTDNRHGTLSRTVAFEFAETGHVGPLMPRSVLRPEDARDRLARAALTTTRDRDTGELTAIRIETVNADQRRGRVVGTTRLDVTETNRQTVRRGLGEREPLHALTFLGTTGRPKNAASPRAAPGTIGDFDRLLFREATYSTVRYTAESKTRDFGAEATVGGLAFGGTTGWESLERTATGAQYLAPPNAEGRRELVPFEECAG